MVIVSVPVILFVIMIFSSRLSEPDVSAFSKAVPERKQISAHYYTLGNNWLRKSESGLWEMYVEGEPYERGLVTGKLSKELIQYQENAFVAQLHHFVPSDLYLFFLKYIVRYFNRNLDRDISIEYLEEIYGISRSASDNYGYVAKKFDRILIYHAAHDVGHALEQYHLVGCSSFAAWGNHSKDSSLIIGRNFDFYVGDDFARNKIIAFYKPAKGYRFMSVSWGGMAGCVSGMNEKGLTVTINAAKSEVPTSASTPISIIVREILQYASSIDEAYKIAKSRNSFVSEILLIGSQTDHMAALIEKTPSTTQLYMPAADYILCSNHFQGAVLKNEEINLKNISESSSGYRYQKLTELINRYQKIDYTQAALMLRDQTGLKGKSIGYSNEKSLNQLICHHSVIFKPSELKVWVSTSPYQIGRYVCYDLNKIFMGVRTPDKEIYEKEFNISSDSFLNSASYLQFLRYKYLLHFLKAAIASGAEFRWNEKSVNDFIATNPDYYGVYEVLGDYFKKNNEIASALKYYNLALKKEIPFKSEVDRIKFAINTIQK
jgi:hypothetical protein